MPEDSESLDDGTTWQKISTDNGTMFVLCGQSAKERIYIRSEDLVLALL